VKVIFENDYLAQRRGGPKPVRTSSGSSGRFRTRRSRLGKDSTGLASSKVRRRATRRHQDDLTADARRLFAQGPIKAAGGRARPGWLDPCSRRGSTRCGATAHCRDARRIPSPCGGRESRSADAENPTRSRPRLALRPAGHCIEADYRAAPRGQHAEPENRVGVEPARTAPSASLDRVLRRSLHRRAGPGAIRIGGRCRRVCRQRWRASRPNCLHRRQSSPAELAARLFQNLRLQRLAVPNAGADHEGQQPARPAELSASNTNWAGWLARQRHHP